MEAISRHVAAQAATITIQAVGLPDHSLGMVEFRPRCPAQPVRALVVAILSRLILGVVVLLDKQQQLLALPTLWEGVRREMQATTRCQP